MNAKQNKVSKQAKQTKVSQHSLWLLAIKLSGMTVNINNLLRAE